MPMPMTSRKPLPQNLDLPEMLKRKTFEQLLEDRDVYEPETAGPAMGYAPMHVRYLCRTNRVEHIERNGRYYLYARTVHSVFKHVPPSAKTKRR